MKELNVLQMEEINGGVKWECVGIAAITLATAGGGFLGGMFFIAAGVAAGCFD